MKTVIPGPNRLKITLDSNEIFPNDPGQGTPAIVEKGQCAGTFACALDTGILLDKNGNDYSLTPSEVRWLESQEQAVDNFINNHS